MSSEQLITIDLNGEATSLPIASHSPLVRAVIISLFTWRRANTDDTLPDNSGNLMGWWGDTFATVAKAQKAKVVQLPAGHSLMTEAPDGVLQALKDFLKA